MVQANSNNKSSTSASPHKPSYLSREITSFLLINSVNSWHPFCKNTSRAYREYSTCKKAFLFVMISFGRSLVESVYSQGRNKQFYAQSARDGSAMPRKRLILTSPNWWAISNPRNRLLVTSSNHSFSKTKDHNMFEEFSLLVWCHAMIRNSKP